MANVVTLIGEMGATFEVDLDLATEGVQERIAKGELTVAAAPKADPKPRAKKPAEGE